MKSKVSELGVFAIGIGLIAIGLIIYGELMGRPADRLPWEDLAVFCIAPGIVILAGIVTLTARCLLAVRVSLWVLTIAFVMDALLVNNPLKMVITALVLFLIWKTGFEAVDEVRHAPEPAASENPEADSTE